uniref:C2H2-type domain-containing protein n=1 Tax=Lactuca sativa TaxID=4236 RepID=A0A9R1VJY0_LACSA|nr:hypothetical protein LSAT_V11C500244340 [Lactuca sativa]
MNKDPQDPPPKKKEKVAKDDTCFECGVGFRKSKELKVDEMVLHVGNRARVVVQDFGNFDLCLPSGLYLTLDNVCLVTSITRNIISVSHLTKSGYDFKFFDDNICSFLKGIFCF